MLKPPLPGNYDLRIGDRWYYPQKLTKETIEVEWRQVYDRKTYRCQVIDAESDKPLQGAYIMFNPAADRNAWQLVSMPEEYRDDLYRNIPIDGCLCRSTKHSVNLPYGSVEKIEYLGRTDKHGLFFLECELDKQAPDMVLWAPGYVGMIAIVYKIQKYGYPDRTGTVQLQVARLLPAGTVRLTIQPPYRIPISILGHYKTWEAYVRNAGLSAEVIFEGTKRISYPWLTPYPAHLVAGSNETGWCLVTLMGANIRFNKEFVCHLPAGVQYKLRIYHNFSKYFQDIIIPINPLLKRERLGHLNHR